MKINSGDNYNSIYNATDLSTQNQNVAGLGENKLSEVNEQNCLAWPKNYERREPGDECRDHRAHHHHHHQRNPIGDPQVAAEIKHLLQQLEQ
ncbi:MAG TPA: hypothetical protein VK466_11240, partial [Terriglobales bacterium]|nr:hypothetical protein [Terriglobales bacterium]